MTTRGEIHVSDIGTVYQVPIYDDDLAQANFDPSGAAVLKIYFSMPQPDGSVETISRTATADEIEIDSVDTWCLIYTVVSADADEFHVAEGPLVLQGYVEYADGRKWHSNKITTDQQGRALRIRPNL